MRGRISEVFESVQGEGIYLGEEQLFVRFFGCNLNCKFCDTKPDTFFEYEPQDLFAKLKLYQRKYHSISFTGGEPLLQLDFLKELLPLTQGAGFKNYLETNGVLFGYLKEVINYLDIVAMDFKLPSSTGEFPCWRAHRDFLKLASKKDVFVKMVICNSTEIDDVKYALDLIGEVNPAVTIVFQPNSNESRQMLDKSINVYKKLCQEYSFANCVIPQMHKVAGLR